MRGAWASEVLAIVGGQRIGHVRRVAWWPKIHEPELTLLGARLGVLNGGVTCGVRGLFVWSLALP